MGGYCQDTPQVRPCRLGRDIHVAHGPGSNHPPQLLPNGQRCRLTCFMSTIVAKGVQCLASGP